MGRGGERRLRDRQPACACACESGNAGAGGRRGRQKAEGGARAQGCASSRPSSGARLARPRTHPACSDGCAIARLHVIVLASALRTSAKGCCGAARESGPQRLFWRARKAWARHARCCQPPALLLLHRARLRGARARQAAARPARQAAARPHEREWARGSRSTCTASSHLPPLRRRAKRCVATTCFSRLCGRGHERTLGDSERYGVRRDSGNNVTQIFPSRSSSVLTQ